MKTVRWAVLLVGVVAFAGGTAGQEKKKEDVKKDDVKKEEPKKAEGKAKGTLPANWKDIVSDDQKPKIYAIQAKYKEEIDKLQKQIEELKAKQLKEQFEILSPDQKLRLEAKIKEKAGIKK